MAIASCHIEVRKGRIIFKIEGCYAVFYHMKEKVVSPNSYLLDDFSPSPEIYMEDVLNCEDPPDFDWISHEDPNQTYVKVQFVASMPPNIPKVEAHISNESSMSDYCKFAQAILSLPPMEGFDAYLIWRLNKSIVACLMGYECALFCTSIMHYGVTL